MDILDELTNPYEKYLCEKADRNRIPLAGTFELTPLCNMQCKMCYIVQKKDEVKKKGGLLSVEQWVDIARQAVDEGMLYLLITGGEPFLYPEFKHLYEELNSLGIYIVINTNGTTLDEETVSWLSKRPPRRLNISVYGASSDTYARLCRRPENFDRVMRNIDLLKKYNILVRLHTVLTPENIQDYDGIVRIANNFEMPLGMAYYMFPSIRKGGKIAENDCRFLPEESAALKLKYYRDSHSENELNELVKDVEYNLKNPEVYEYYGYEHPVCRGGLSSFWVNWHGEMLPCGMMKNPSADLLHTTFHEGWQMISGRTAGLHLCSDCAVCSKRRYCNICMAAVYAETGGYEKKPDYLCRMTEAYVGLLKQEYEKICKEN